MVKNRRRKPAEARKGGTGMEEFRSLLIKDTTREERIRIVNSALAVCGTECEFCSGCDNRGGGKTETYYQPYIDGEKELRELNGEFRTGTVL